MSNLKTYIEHNTCVVCGDGSNVVYHQCTNNLTCQSCGASFEIDGKITELYINGEIVEVSA
jgi:transcription elongation factor Elf1